MAKSEVHHILVLSNLIHVMRKDMSVRRYREFSDTTRERLKRLANHYESYSAYSGFRIDNKPNLSDKFAQIGVE